MEGGACFAWGGAMTGRRARFLFLQRLISAFVVANADGFLHFGQENFAVADFAGFGGFENGLDGLLDEFIGENDFDFDFGEQIDFVLAAAVGFGVAFLAAVPAHFENRHALNAD